jgi:peptidase S41-like protein/tricorn protease-like protein
MKRRSVLLAAIPLLSCTLVLGPEGTTDRQAVFDELWREFDRHYSFFELKGIDWAAVRDQNRPQLGASEAALLNAIRRVFEQLDDPHVALIARGTIVGASVQRLTEPTYFSDATVFTRYVTASRTTPHLRYGSRDGIGYVLIPSFKGSGWGAEIEIALRDLDNISGLIIDVRDNQGGNNGNGREIAGRFADQRRLYAYDRYRNGPSHSDFTDFNPREIHPIGTHFGGGVVVLTNRHTGSASESFILMMRVIPGVSIIGDTTAGALSDALSRELSNGWSLQLSESINYTPDKQTFEDVGLVPSILVKATIADSIDKYDRALERAIQVLQVRSTP